MIPPEILFRLVPDREPHEEFPRDPRLSEIDPESPGARIGVWANFLRYRISRELAENHELDKLLETSGFVATGVFRVPSTGGADNFEGFPIVSGLQFGAVLFRGAPAARTDVDYITRVSIEIDGFHAPLVQTLATLNPHAPQPPAGYVAAVYEDDNGEDCGITAGHVVEKYSPRQWVPVYCSDCGYPAKLVVRAPALIDAAKITFPCGGPVHVAGGQQPGSSRCRRRRNGRIASRQFRQDALYRHAIALHSFPDPQRGHAQALSDGFPRSSGRQRISGIRTRQW